MQQCCCCQSGGQTLAVTRLLRRLVGERADREVMTRGLLGRGDIEFEFEIEIKARTKRIGDRRRSEKNDSSAAIPEMPDNIEKEVDVKNG